MASLQGLQYPRNNNNFENNNERDPDSLSNQINTLQITQPSFNSLPFPSPTSSVSRPAPPPPNSFPRISPNTMNPLINLSISGPTSPRPPPGTLPSCLLSKAPVVVVSSSTRQDFETPPLTMRGPPRQDFGLPPVRVPHTVVASQGDQVRNGFPVQGMQTWRQMAPPVTMQPPPTMMPPPPPVTMQPPRMVGMAPFQSDQPVMETSSYAGHLPMGGERVKVNSMEYPRPSPSTSVIIYETREGKMVNPPPPATSEYIVKDTGNCSPCYMRCTLNKIPCTSDLLKLSSMPLDLIIQPLALLHQSEEPIQIVDFGESGPVRCSCCKGYMNPFMKFINQGRCFICNLCGKENETPPDYYCHLGPDGRRTDADERPELCRGTVEFVATKEFNLRDPMPAVYFFLIDVSINAIRTGATATTCNAIKRVIADLPEGPRTMVGIATYDSSIHFYNLKHALQQPLMLVVPDIQDVYTPLQTDVIVTLSECRQNLEQLLEDIPIMFQSNNIADSAFVAAIKAAFLAMKTTGGKILVFQSVLPSAGIGALSARENEAKLKETHKLLQPADKFLNTMAMELAEYQVCVDVFITTQTYVDIASVSVIPKTTGGQVYYYYPFSALGHSDKLCNDLRWNITRPQGFEATMRVRCSKGLEVQECLGNYSKSNPTDLDLPGIDCDKTIMITLKHEGKFPEGSECAFQCALVYTTIDGQRRIRVNTLSLPCTNVLKDLFLSADVDTLLSSFLKQAVDKMLTSAPIKVQEQLINICINILQSYRERISTQTSSGHLFVPKTLTLLPLYILALIKSTGLQTNGRIDDRSYWISRVSFLSTPLAALLVYPRLMALNSLLSEEANGSLAIPTIPLSCQHIYEDGIFLLENGEDALIYVGDRVDSYILQQLFGVSLTDISTQFVLQQYDNPLSKKLNDLITKIRCLRSSYLSLRVCRKGDPSAMLFDSYMVEDSSPEKLSYAEFLPYLRQQIQTKTS